MESEEPSESSLMSRVAKLPEMELPKNAKRTAKENSKRMPELTAESDDEEDTKKETRPVHSYADAVRSRNVFVDQSGKIADRVIPGQKYVIKELSQNKTKPLDSINLFTAVPSEEINVLPSVVEPEFIDVEFTADTGATVHVADKDSLPCHVMQPSVGSRMRQNFQAAGGKLLANEGEINIIMLPPMWMRASNCLLASSAPK